MGEETMGYSHDVPSLMETPLPTSSPVTISTQVLERGGAMKARTLETSGKTALCRDMGIVGTNVAASGKNHVLLWMLTDGTAVMFATNNLDDVKPLQDLKIESVDIPEELKASDVSPNPGDVPLIYVDCSPNPQNLRSIQEKTQVRNFTHIPPGSPDDRRFGSWMVAYEGTKSRMSIFPAGEDIHLTYTFENGAQEATSTPFYKNYSKYFQEGGVIGLAFMRDASTFEREAMRQKYPRNRFYVGDPQEQIEYIYAHMRIYLTTEQQRLYYNLRWIPAEFPQVIIDVGFHPPKSYFIKENKPYVHPKELDEIGILSQVFKFTQDRDGEDVLRAYCKRLQRYS